MKIFLNENENSLRKSSRKLRNFPTKCDVIFWKREIKLKSSNSDMETQIISV
jgi:hypothetical protein